MTISEIIEQKLGIKSEEDFDKFYDDRVKNGTTDEEIELLNPEKIDNEEFWQYIDKNFSRAVCGSGGDKDLAFKLNLALVLDSGIINKILSYRAINPEHVFQILEIGPGYGTIPTLLDAFRVKTLYNAVDVRPKFETVQKVSGNGELTEDILSKEYHYIIAHNTFQHLTINQRRQYYTNINKVLHKNGSFHISMPMSPHFNTIKYKEREYICHFGQFTPLQTYQEIKNDIEQYAKLKCTTVMSRFDCFNTMSFMRYIPNLFFKK